MKTPREVWLEDQRQALDADLAADERAEPAEAYTVLDGEPQDRLRDLVAVLWCDAKRCEHAAPNRVQRLEWNGRYDAAAVLVCDDCAPTAWEARKSDPCQVCRFKTSDAWLDASMTAPDGSAVVRVRTRLCSDCAGLHDADPWSGDNTEKE